VLDFVIICRLRFCLASPQAKAKFADKIEISTDGGSEKAKLSRMWRIRLNLTEKIRRFLPPAELETRSAISRQPVWKVLAASRSGRRPSYFFRALCGGVLWSRCDVTILNQSTHVSKFYTSGSFNVDAMK
jgi:hypothetical protein